MFFAGLDIGSQSSEAVIINQAEDILACATGLTGLHSTNAAQTVLGQALEQAGLGRKDLTSLVATGYGRVAVPFADRQLTEITCHALGAYYYFPGTSLVVDIGGQDCKVISLDSRGRPRDFVLNDKCAAGTGRFLEVMSNRLGRDISEMGPLALLSRRPKPITSLCTVFAESEVVELVAHNTPPQDIAAGLINAVVARLWSMMQGLWRGGEVTLSGGGAYNVAIQTGLEARLRQKAQCPPDPRITGALGAALAARRKTKLYDSGLTVKRQSRSPAACLDNKSCPKRQRLEV